MGLAAHFCMAQTRLTIPANHPIARAFGFTVASLVTAGRVGLPGVSRDFSQREIMRLFIVLIVVALFALSVIALVAVGLCIGMAYLMVYFVPSLDLPATLVPAAILATTVILMLGSVFTAWFSAGIRNTYPSLYAYNDDEDEEGYEPEPPTVTRTRSYPVKKNRR